MPKRPNGSRRSSPRAPLLLGAHVSSAGGVDRAPERGHQIGARAIQLFTKTPSQWREPRLSAQTASRFRAAVRRAGIAAVVAHDSYLINLASPVPTLRERSIRSLIAELKRCRLLGIEAVISHPGNFMDDRDTGILRNAEGYETCLAAVSGPVRILLETTAGMGTALGRSFEELAAIRKTVADRHRGRIGFCADTCHMYSAGYDLTRDYDGVWDAWDRVLGLEHLGCLHLNDSKTPFASNRDRHAWIGEGSLGPEPFRRIMRDTTFVDVIKVIETPKAGDPVRHDRRMLRRLRAYAGRRRA